MQQERDYYEYIFSEGKIIHKLYGDLLDTRKASEVTKWIFVMSTCKKLYVGEVRFHGQLNTICFAVCHHCKLIPSKVVAEKERKISSF